MRSTSPTPLRSRQAAADEEDDTEEAIQRSLLLSHADKGGAAPSGQRPGFSSPRSAIRRARRTQNELDSGFCLFGTVLSLALLAGLWNGGHLACWLEQGQAGQWAEMGWPACK